MPYEQFDFALHNVLVHNHPLDDFERYDLNPSEQDRAFYEPLVARGWGILIVNNQVSQVREIAPAKRRVRFVKGNDGNAVPEVYYTYVIR